MCSSLHVQVCVILFLLWSLQLAHVYYKDLFVEFDLPIFWRKSSWCLLLVQHSCQPLLGVNLSPEFVNLYFPYAGQGLLFCRWWQQHFEFQPAHVAVEGRSNVVQNTRAHFKSHFQWDFLAYCTRPVSVRLVMTCVGCSFNSFSVFLLSLKQQQNLMKIMFSCIHFPIWPYLPKIMREKNVFYTGKLYGLTGMVQS